MVTESVPESAAPFKSSKIETLDGPVQIIDTQPQSRLVITLDLTGIISIKIVADESASAECLEDLLASVFPILELLHRTVNALNPEPVGAGN